MVSSRKAFNWGVNWSLRTFSQLLRRLDCNFSKVQSSTSLTLLGWILYKHRLFISSMMALVHSSDLNSLAWSSFEAQNLMANRMADANAYEPSRQSSHFSQIGFVDSCPALDAWGMTFKHSSWNTVNSSAVWLYMYLCLPNTLDSLCNLAQSSSSARKGANLSPFVRDKPSQDTCCTGSGSASCPCSCALIHLSKLARCVERRQCCSTKCWKVWLELRLCPSNTLPLCCLLVKKAALVGFPKYSKMMVYRMTWLLTTLWCQLHRLCKIPCRSIYKHL